MSEEVLDKLTDWHPLFQPCIDYLVRHEKGLNSPHQEIGHAYREAILLVDQEISRQRDQRREEERELDSMMADAKAKARAQS
jgi:uncharacterized protein YigA (DUF484 family)